MCKPPLLKVSSFVNPLEKRTAKKVNGVITEKYLWADLTTLLAVYDGNNNLVQRFNYADNRMPISMTQDNQTYYLHYDQVGTLRAVTDKNQNIIKETTYDSFGNILQDTNPNFKIPFGFAGGLHDRDTNLVHFGYREYDPYTGKWTAKDPIDFSGGDSNLYGYVLNDPINFVDPTGQFKALLNIFTIIGLYEFGQYCKVLLDDTEESAPEYKPNQDPEKYIEQYKEHNQHFQKTLNDARNVGKSGLENGIYKPLGGVPNGN